MRGISLRKYLYLAAAMCAQPVRYSAPMVLACCLQIAILLANQAVWTSVYAHQGGVPTYTLPAMMSYLLVAAVIRAGTYNRADREVAQALRTGAICRDLLLPLDHQAYTLMRVLGPAAWRFVYTALTVSLVATLVMPLSIPLGPGLLWGAAAILLSFLILTLTNYVLGLLALWTSAQSGLAHAKDLLLAVLGGGILPLEIYPGWLQRVAAFLPFRSAIYQPAQLFLGRVAGRPAVAALLEQLGWILLLYLLGRLLWRVALRRLVVNGG